MSNYSYEPMQVLNKGNAPVDHLPEKRDYLFSRRKMLALLGIQVVVGTVAANRGFAAPQNVNSTSKTEENLMTAFAGESQANRKYLAYAKQAEKEGLSQVAKLFRAAAEAETIHAHAHLRNAGKIGDTAANLKDALEGETYEFTKMYPPMIVQAEAEGDKMAAKFFGYASAVEEVHANLYKKALADPKGLASVDYYLCNVCGYTHEGTCAKCPVCGTGENAFFKAG